MASTILSQLLTDRGAANRRDPHTLRVRAHTRILERIDPLRSRHKPPSILIQEAWRILQSFFEIEAPYLSKPERDNLAEEVIQESICLGPLEELFREEAISEIMVLSYSQVIVRKAGTWLPTSVHFRSADHYRRTIAMLSVQGETSTTYSQDSGSLEVRLINGFRALAVLPPVVMDHPPATVFIRMNTTPSAFTDTPLLQADPHPTPVLKKVTGSKVVMNTQRPISPPTPAPLPAVRNDRVNPILPKTPSAHDSDAFSFQLPAVSEKDQMAGRMHDPLEKIRLRITEKLINKLSSAGLYDIRLIPPSELHKIVSNLVTEVNIHDKLGFDSSLVDEVTLAILAGIQR